MELQLFTVKDVAKYLELTEETIREKLRNKSLKGFKIGKSWRITKENLDSFIGERYNVTTEGS